MWIKCFWIKGFWNCLAQTFWAQFDNRVLSKQLLSSSDPHPDPLFGHSFWHTIWKYMLDMLDLYSNILSGILSGIYSGILSGIRSYSDILSGILSGIYSDILSDIISGFTHRKVDRRFWVLSWTFFFPPEKNGSEKNNYPPISGHWIPLEKITLGYPYHDTNQHGSQVINLLYI